MSENQKTIIARIVLFIVIVIGAVYAISQDIDVNKRANNLKYTNYDRRIIQQCGEQNTGLYGSFNSNGFIVCLKDYGYTINR